MNKHTVAIILMIFSMMAANNCSSEKEVSPTPKYETLLDTACRSAVQWVVEGKDIQGVDYKYPDVSYLKAKKAIFMASECTTPGIKLSNDQRITMITEAEAKEMKSNGDIAVIVVSALQVSPNKITVSIDSYFGFLAANGYYFEFTQEGSSLLATAELIWAA
jgi:hypothetical protein